MTPEQNSPVLQWAYRILSLALQLAIFIALMFCTVAAMDVRREMTTMPKWEYKSFFTPDTASFSVSMNALGDDGWDVISSRRATANANADQWGYDFVLRRKKK